MRRRRRSWHSRCSGYLNNRYYDPALGAFTSVDPLVGKTGTPYLYANGNPSTLSDPSGLDPAYMRGDLCYYDGICLKGSHGGQRAAPPVGCGWSCGVGTLNSPAEPMDIGEEKYSVGWYLFPNNHGGAKEWMAKIQANPDVYFPFKVEVADCSAGDCSQPLAEGNVLHLSGQYEIGSVEVIQVTSTSFTFLALSDHQLAAGGMIQFEIYEKPVGDQAEVYLSIRASESTGGMEAHLPGWTTKAAAKITWSSMVAALICEWGYVGQEQYRRC